MYLYCRSINDFTSTTNDSIIDDLPQHLFETMDMNEMWSSQQDIQETMDVNDVASDNIAMKTDEMQWMFLDTFYQSYDFKKIHSLPLEDNISAELMINTVNNHLLAEYANRERELKKCYFIRLFRDKNRDVTLAVSITHMKNDVKVSTILKIQIGDRFIYIYDLQYFCTLLSFDINSDQYPINKTGYYNLGSFEIVQVPERGNFVLLYDYSNVNIINTKHNSIALCPETWLTLCDLRTQLSDLISIYDDKCVFSNHVLSNIRQKVLRKYMQLCTNNVKFHLKNILENTHKIECMKYTGTQSVLAKLIMRVDLFSVIENEIRVLKKMNVL